MSAPPYQYLQVPSLAPSHTPNGSGSRGEELFDTAAAFELGPPIQTIGAVKLFTDSDDERGAVHMVASAEEKLTLHRSAAGAPLAGAAVVENVSVTVAVCVVFGCHIASGGHVSLRDALTAPLDVVKSSTEPGTSVQPSILEEAETINSTVPSFTLPPSFTSFPSLRQPKKMDVPTLDASGHTSRAGVGCPNAVTPGAAAKTSTPHMAATTCIPGTTWWRALGIGSRILARRY